MKKIISIITAAALFCCMPFPVLRGQALSGTGGPGVTWTYENGRLTLSGSGSTMDLAERFSLEIADTLHILNDPWADFRSEIREIVVEDGITDIGQLLFADTTALEKITLPDSVTAFESCAFFHSGIINADMPENLTFIGSNCFQESKLRTADLPEKLETIGANCFAGCEQLISVTMQDSVRKIGKNAFYSCEMLSRIRLSQGLTELPSNCFSCTKLREVTIPEHCTKIGKFCFAVCPSLLQVRIPSGVQTIEEGAFRGCSGLQQIELPDGIRTVTRALFSECSSLKELTVPESVTCIEQRAFERCQFETLRLPSHQQLEIQEHALPEAWLEKQNGFLILGDGMLYHYGGSDAELTLPDSVKTVMPGFLGESGVRKLILGSHVQEIRHNAFESSTLEAVVFPSDDVKIDSKAADGAENLTAVTGKRYSSAHIFAVQNGFRFTASDPEPQHHRTQEIYGKQNLSFGNSPEVFGSSCRITPFQEALLLDAADSEAIRSEIRQQKSQEWAGSCYGLSVVTVLAQTGILPLSALDPEAHTLSEVRPTEQAVNLINYYYLSHTLQNIQRKDESASDRTQYERLARTVRYAEDAGQGGSPFVIQIVLAYGAHAVVGYDIEDGEWTWDGFRYPRRIRVWDSNYFAAPDDGICLYFDPDTLYWTLPAYGIGFRNDPGKDVGGIISVIRESGTLNGCPIDPTQEIAGNTDGKDGLNTADAVLLLRWISEDTAASAITFTGSYLSDLDGNGILDLNDAAALMRLLAAG